MIGAQSDSTGTSAGGSESMAGEGSGSLETRLSIAAEDTAFVAGSIHPSMDGAIGSELRVGAVAGAVS